MNFLSRNKQDNKLFIIRNFILLTTILASFIPIQALSGMVWQTTKAVIGSGNVITASNYMNNIEGVLVSVDYNDQTPNPCAVINCSSIRVAVFANQGISGLGVGLGTYRVATTGFKTPLSSNVKEIKEAKTMGELYRYLSDNNILNPGFISNGASSPYYCDPDTRTNCLIMDKKEAYSRLCFALSHQTNSSSNFEPLPGQNCIGPTPPNNECIVDTGSVTLDHGELFADNVDGNKKSQHVKISCTYSANADVAIYSKDANDQISLNSDRSLYSTITIDGVQGTLGKKISIPNDGATIVLESTLHTVGDVTEGAFSGTGILVINNY